VGRSHVDIAWWNGTAFEIGFSGDGGPASSFTQPMQPTDVNGDGHREVILWQAGDGGAASLSIWRVVGARAVEPLVAVGGCMNGSNTYGVVGVELGDRNGDGSSEIYATCDGSASGQPRESWP